MTPPHGASREACQADEAVVPVPLSLHARSLQWRALPTVSSAHIDIVENGVRIWLTANPPPAHLPNHKLTDDQAAWVTNEINDLLLKGCIRQLPAGERPQITSPIGVAEGKKRRLIADLRYLNEFVSIPKVRFEAWPEVAHNVRTGDWLAKIDLKAGFHHLFMRPDQQHLLGLEWRGIHYEWVAMPFGLRASPAVFNKILRPVIELWRSQGKRAVIYVDDLLLISESRERLEREIDEAIEMLQRLGWRINFEKSVLRPAQRLEYLGLIIDTRRHHRMPVLEVPAAKRASIKKDAQRLLREFDAKRPVQTRFLARWIGQATACIRAVMPARAYLRHCHGDVSRAVARSGWYGTTTISSSAATELQWWRDNMSASSIWRGRSLLDARLASTAQYTVTTDASPAMWGGSLHHFGQERARLSAVAWTQGPWPASWHVENWHSNERELAAVLLCMTAFQDQLASTDVLVRTDNTVTLAALRRLCGGNERLNNLALKICALNKQHDIYMWAQHISGVDNELADTLSRHRVTPRAWEWSLSASFVAELQRAWRINLTVDRFADLSNAKCPRFNSYTHQPLAESIDAFTQDWNNEVNLVNPPFRLLDRVIAKLEAEPAATAIVIAPRWPAQSWFTRLVEMASARVTVPSTAVLPPPAISAHASARTAEPLRSTSWTLEAWLILPRACSSRAVTRQPTPPICSPAEQRPLSRATTTRSSDGAASATTSACTGPTLSPGTPRSTCARSSLPRRAADPDRRRRPSPPCCDCSTTTSWARDRRSSNKTHVQSPRAPSEAAPERQRARRRSSSSTPCSTSCATTTPTLPTSAAHESAQLRSFAQARLCARESWRKYNDATSACACCPESRPAPALPSMLRRSASSVRRSRSSTCSPSGAASTMRC
jgi:hypothetical protein